MEEIVKKAALVRKWCLVSTTEAGSGHPTSCLSSADIGTVLFDKFLEATDHFVLSKGHCAPLLYTLFALSGSFPLEELKTLRKFQSPLEGHPVPHLPFIDAATGSLGQGLSIGAGLAYALREENGKSPEVYTLLGDGEMAEGNVWEAANFASYYKLNNLIAIVDVNRLGQSQETMFGHKTEEYVNKFKAFDWEVISIDGHNFEEIDKAFKSVLENKTEKPFAIIAKTIKGKGISFLEDKEGWHGKALKKEELDKALSELGEVDEKLRFNFKHRTTRNRTQNNAEFSLVQPDVQLSSAIFKIGDEIATREVYGKVLAELGNENDLIYALDGDLKNSTFSEIFKNAHPERFIECFIAEQNMVGVAIGLSAIGKIPFVSSYGAFLTRAFDQIRMAGISKANIKFVGSHAGVSIGQDGPSQMGLEDLAMFGAIPDSVIFHPSDAISIAKIMPLILNHQGISYLRTLRPKTPVIYDQNEEFKIGGSKILKSSESDVLTVAACGITVFEVLKAYEELKKEGINIRVLDCYSIKPIDKETLKQCINSTIQPLIITVEDHYEHGGLGDFVLSAVSKTGAKVEKMAVSKIPCSGTKDELLNFFGISSDCIVKKARSLLQ